MLQATLCDNIGLMKYEEVLLTLSAVHFTKPVSDENITVMDTDFNDIPVRLYLPKWKSERQRPAVIYIHGGSFVLGSYKLAAYDDLNRWTANKLDAVVVGIELAPKYPFPAALEDCVYVIKFFLQENILAKYRVDPTRICIMGDSSGGTLAATVTQLHMPTESRHLFKDDSLIYISRLRNVGVKVTHEHIEKGVHGALSFTRAPVKSVKTWKVMALDAVAKTCNLVATLCDNIGLMKYEDVLVILASVHFTKPVSDENITVMDTEFRDIPVRLYLPKMKSERHRPAVIFIHGGAFVLGSYKISAYDDLNRWTANKLDAVVVGIE
ncbi:AADACL2 family member 3 [Apodemus speciosus]|uniref:AADACL2 family member 3 n=1 Tax=Apodemus speciosus TaxID=105296 RepID=A0ABQ0EKG6_APOSI